MLRFFGLTSNDKDVYLEPIYLLIKHLGFSYKDAYSLPVWQRKWFIQRLNKDYKEEKERNKPTLNNTSSVQNRNIFNKSFK